MYLTGTLKLYITQVVVESAAGDRKPEASLNRQVSIQAPSGDRNCGTFVHREMNKKVAVMFRRENKVTHSPFRLTTVTVVPHNKISTGTINPFQFICMSVSPNI